MAAWGMIASVAGQGLSSILGLAGGILGGNTEMKIAEWESDLSMYKAKMARQQADWALAQQKLTVQMEGVREARMEEEKDRIISAQRVAAAKSGVLSANHLELEIETATDIADAIDMMKWSSAVERTNLVWEYNQALTQADLYVEEARMQKEAGKAARTQSYIGGVASLLGGGGRVISSGYSMGLFGKKT